MPDNSGHARGMGPFLPCTDTIVENARFLLFGYSITHTATRSTGSTGAYGQRLWLLRRPLVARFIELSAGDEILLLR